MTTPAKEENQPSGIRIGSLLAVLIVIVILAAALFGDRGILQVWRATKQKTALEAETKELEAKAEQLRQEIKSLQDDPRYLENLARKELGMVKKDELVYQFPASAAKPASLPPNPPAKP